MTHERWLSQEGDVQYQTGDIGFMMTAGILALLMTPGVGFFYAGLQRRKSALSALWLSNIAIAITGIQWFIWGYTLCFSTAGPFIGDCAHIVFEGVFTQPSELSPHIPRLLLAFYHGMPSTLAAGIISGALAERGRMLAWFFFLFVWLTVVYDTVARWVWNPSGWIRQMGGLDFAGGSVVHVASGVSALVYSMMLGKRRGYGTSELGYRPHNVPLVVLGTALMWVGWIGGNAGAALAANMRAVMVTVVTNIAACVGGITWCLLDYRFETQYSTVGFCSGVVAGLVAITPGCGYVPAWAAVIFGILGAAAANLATRLKFLLGIDDALDIFAVHGVGGIVGVFCTGVFAADYIAHLDQEEVIHGGWLNGHSIQLGYQVVALLAVVLFSFCVTYFILCIIKLIPGLRLRVSDEDEDLGLDDAQIGEFGYDYVKVTREILSGS